MGAIAKVYFSHLSNLFFIAVFAGLMGLCWNQGWLQQYAWLLVLPVLLEPFLEYFLHKFALHASVPNESGWRQRYMKRLHYDHHLDPSVPKLLFAPFGTIFISLGVVFLAWSLVTWSWQRGAVLALGEIGCYLAYEWVHLAHHSTYKPLTAYGRKMKQAHLWHHYVNENYWWGITSHLADRLLGSYVDPNSVAKSETARNLEGRGLVA